MAHNWDVIRANPQLGLQLRTEEASTMRLHSKYCLDRNNYRDGVKALSLSISLRHEILARYHHKRSQKKKYMQGVIDDVQTFMRVSVVAEEMKKIKTQEEEAKMQKVQQERATKYIGWKIPTVPPTDLAQEGFKTFKHCIKFPEKNSKAWDDVVGHGQIKDYIEEAILFPLMFQDMMPTDISARGVLLYGPPGTGKTMIAKAIASKLDVCYVELKGGELMSKWLGESEKNIRNFFAMIEYLLPCIVFIDEIDALAGRRDTDSDAPESKRGISNQLLQEMENKKGLFMVTATNMPWQLDPAFMRRLGQKCYVKLPNEKQRRKLIDKVLEEIPHSLMDTELNQIAKYFNGYSSSDICDYLKEVCKLSLRKLHRANYFAQNDKGTWYACSAINLRARKTTFEDLQAKGEKVAIPNLTCKDFEVIKLDKNCKDAELRKYEQFNEEH